MKLIDLFTEEELSDCFLTYKLKGFEGLVEHIEKMLPVINEKAKQPMDARYLAYNLQLVTNHNV